MAEHTTFKVFRYNPETDSKPYFQSYRVQLQEGKTILDALNEIKGQQDGTLTYRMSCRSAICGSCGMVVNGHSKLVCRLQIAEVLKNFDEVVIEPMRNFEVIRDLVVNMDRFWDKMDKVTPWLVADEENVPATERLQSPQNFNVIRDASSCIMCGVCLSDCTSLEVDGNFLGPAALAKAFRMAADSRSIDREERLLELSDEGGVWDCARCYECVQVCPKYVAPMETIMKLREMTLMADLIDNRGSRHVEHFTESVLDSGILDERRLPLKTVGLTDLKGMLHMAPTGLRMLLKGKMPLIHPHIKDVDELQRIAHKVEESK